MHDGEKVSWVRDLKLWRTFQRDELQTGMGSYWGSNFGDIDGVAISTLVGVMGGRQRCEVDYVNGRDYRVVI